MNDTFRKLSAVTTLGALVLTGCAHSGTNVDTTPAATPIVATSAPQAIKHIVVIFGENISYDHYFGTYPNALNLPGETPFTATANTPSSDNYIKYPGLLTANPNLNAANGAGASNPFRLSPKQALTASQDHNYIDEQGAYDSGAMDLFPLSVGTADSATVATNSGAAAIASTKGLTMGYFDGNTVTAMWNLAQHYAMNDHSFSTNFGPSSPGAINLISGQSNGLVNSLNLGTSAVADGNGGFTIVGDADPYNDICSSTSKYTAMIGKNVGDLLNAKNITWGFFEGGFDLGITNSNSTTGCGRSTAHVASNTTGTVVDYSPHHQPFQYYASTANSQHLRPAGTIGATDQANHQYDIHDFTDALAAGVMPAVAFLKAPAYQDGHASNSDPLNEQTFVVNMVNAIEKSQFWSSTAIIIAYDDSDGWYDHELSLINGSNTTSDKLNGTNLCISTTAANNALPGVDGKPHAQGRCGYGTRQPLLVISPWAKKNYIDSTITDQTSILRFIEDVFLGGQRIGQGSFDSMAGGLDKMFDFSNAAAPPNPAVVQLNPTTGVVTSGN